MRSLVGLFFRMEEVKKETGVEALGVGAVKPRKIGRVGVLGAGVMGGGIAQLAADRGLPVRMKDIKPEALALGYAQAARIWKEKLKKRRMTRAEFAGKMALLGGSLDYAGFETCDITIEAVLEKMAVKHAVLAEWEKVVPATAIFASNTSTLPITDIAANAAHPERVVGMHFFNPVYKMPLVEVIYGKKTDPEVTATIFDLAKKMGKTPVVVKDSPGFLVNRILGPYIAEAARLVLEGVDFTAIDKAMRAFGMPVGPIELLDDVGIDVAAKASETLSKAWPDRMPQDPALEKLVTAGRIGRKAKKGFYFYEGERRGGPDPEAYRDLGLSSPSKNLSSSEIVDRLILPMINEAAYCLSEGDRREPREAGPRDDLRHGLPAVPRRALRARGRARRQGGRRGPPETRQGKWRPVRSRPAPDRDGENGKEILRMRENERDPGDSLRVVPCGGTGDAANDGRRGLHRLSFTF